VLAWDTVNHLMGGLGSASEFISDPRTPRRASPTCPGRPRVNRDTSCHDRGVRAALLDVDGTLIDSTQTYRAIWRAWSDHHGLEFDRVWAATHGVRPLETFAEVAPHLDPHREYRRVQALLAAHGDAFHPLPGARELLAALPAGRWALVTSAPAYSVRRRFQVCGLPLPDVIIDGDSVAAGKPSPEGYLRAAAMLGIATTHCLVLEDAPAGVTAGRAAGATVFAVATTHQPHLLADAHQCFPNIGTAHGSILNWLGRTMNRTVNNHHY
jgi:mannitol-1-/sugar-/sorbitol-6-phosphatase